MEALIRSRGTWKCMEFVRQRLYLCAEEAKPSNFEGGEHGATVDLKDLEAFELLLVLEEIWELQKMIFCSRSLHGNPVSVREEVSLAPLLFKPPMMEKYQEKTLRGWKAPSFILMVLSKKGGLV